METNGKKRPTQLDKDIRAFYDGFISAKTFVESIWSDSWDSLLAYVKESGFNLRNGNLPASLLSEDKRAEFEEALAQYNKEKNNFIDSKRAALSVIYTKHKNENIKFAILKFFRNEISADKLLLSYGGSWDELLDILVSAKPTFKTREDIPQEFLSKKAEFDEAIVQYFKNEYCTSTKLLVNGEYINPPLDAVNKVISFYQGQEIPISKNLLGRAISGYLRGALKLEDIPNTNQSTQTESLEQTGENLQGIEESLDEKKSRLQEIRWLLSHSGLDVSRIQEYTSEIISITKDLDAIQKTIGNINPLPHVKDSEKSPTM